DLDFEVPDENIDLTLERASNFNVAGGGNIVLIEPGIGGVQPVVLAQDNLITPRLSVSIMASTLLQAPNDDITGLTSAEFFDYFKTHDAQLETTRDNTFGRANAASQGDSFRQNFKIFVLIPLVLVLFYVLNLLILLVLDKMIVSVEMQ